MAMMLSWRKQINKQEAIKLIELNQKYVKILSWHGSLQKRWIMIDFDNKLNEFHRQLVCGEVYSRIQGKNEETLAMISLYHHGAPLAKLEAKRWLQKVIGGER